MEGLRRQTKSTDPAGEIDKKKYEALRRNQLEATGMSVNYKGDPWLSGNRSAEIPDNENTALWITNLPPDCDYPIFMSTIRDCGKVFACVINSPVEGKHDTAACKLVFFDTRGAQALMAQARVGVFRVPDKKRTKYWTPRVSHNRIKSRARGNNVDTRSSIVPSPYPQNTQYHSRCLRIAGPSALVNEAHLMKYFKAKFEFQIECVRTL